MYHSLAYSYVGGYNAFVESQDTLKIQYIVLTRVSSTIKTYHTPSFLWKEREIV